ncbi:MAG: ECF transporter S component [Candidatus Thermoplasmatota archaeon]
MKYHFTTKDLVTIALLSALGGVLSTYIGYLGNMVNHIIGVPFGAGQFMAGLHVIWIMLALGITRKKGAATATGLLKGVIELFMGSTHGIVIVAVSLVQGLIPDLILFRDKAKEDRSPTLYAVAGGLSSASNVVVFYTFFLAGVPAVLIAMLCMLAAASGIIFGGWLVLEMLESLEFSGMVLGKRRIVVDDPSVEESAWTDRKAAKRRARAAAAVMAVFLAAFTVGAVYYYAVVYDVTEAGTAEVTGLVEEPYTFRYTDFEEFEVVVNAELIGSVTHVDPRDYEGVSLWRVVEEAQPQAGASEVVVSATDGYYAVFQMDDVLGDGELILTLEDGRLRVVAANYEGAYWVEDVTKVEVR